MGVMNKFKDMIGLEEYDDELYEDEHDEYYDDSVDEEETSSYRRNDNLVSMQSRKPAAGGLQMVVIEPEGFEECARLVDELKSRKPIILNLEKLDVELARKIFDFLGGATYALDGSVQKVANYIFVFAPENVAIDADGESKPYNFTDPGTDYNPWK